MSSKISINSIKKEKMLVFTAPSGSGKTTIVRYLLKEYEQLAFSVSATTRPQRDYEEDGKDYYFLSDEAFKQKIANDEFIEWEEVYENRLYGTLKSEVKRLWRDDKYTLFDIDVVGASDIKRLYGDQCLAVFVKPPSVEVLVERLKKRKTETVSSLKRRVERFNEEMSYEKNFDRILINDKLEVALAEAEKLVEDFLQISKRNTPDDHG